MIAGDLHPELGGARKYLDIIGVDYYPWTQWIYASGLLAKFCNELIQECC